MVDLDIEHLGNVPFYRGRIPGFTESLDYPVPSMALQDPAQSKGPFVSGTSLSNSR